MTSVLAILLATTLLAPAEDSLAAARDLYASAAYEDALAVLSRLPQSNQPLEVTRAVEQYRALCLLALGRTAEAEHAIEAVIAGDPAFRPAADVSPRVRATFGDVRRRMLPAIIQQTYAAAKSAFDRKEFSAAASGFTQMLVMMTDPDVEAAAARPPLSDLRTLASGFRELAAAAAAPPPPPPAPAPVPEAPPAPVATVVPRVYTASDAKVVAPVTIRQQLPAYPGALVIARQGMLDVLIDENGIVQTATMTQSITPQYDAMAVAAAKNWRYRPATLNGTPVKYRKAVQVSVKPH
jgi:tetratricopeptide (TPR) repeat protein